MYDRVNIFSKNCFKFYKVFIGIIGLYKIRSIQINIIMNKTNFNYIVFKKY